MENGRDVRRGKLRSWTPCVQPRVEPHSWRAATYILCKRKASNTNDLYAVAVICVGARVYMRARSCSLRTYAQIIIGENLKFGGFAIDRQIAKLKRSPKFPAIR